MIYDYLRLMHYQSLVQIAFIAFKFHNFQIKVQICVNCKQIQTVQTNRKVFLNDFCFPKTVYLYFNSYIELMGHERFNFNSFISLVSSLLEVSQE